MHNKKGFNRLGRKPSHLKSLHRNMVTSLIKHERITTTAAKAKAIRRTAEKLVTRAKVDSVHNRRIAAKTLYEKEVLNTLFTEIGPRFVDRPGGYTRILKTGLRKGDAAEMVVLEFLEDDDSDLDNEKQFNRKKAKKSRQTALIQDDEISDTSTNETEIDGENEYSDTVDEKGEDNQSSS